MLQLPTPLEANSEQMVQCIIDASEENKAEIMPILVSPVPGKYYEVDTMLLYTLTDKEDKSKTKLIVIFDCNSLTKIPLPYEIEESQRTVQTIKRTEKENKN